LDIFLNCHYMNIRLSAVLLVLSIGISLASDPRLEQGAIFEAKGDYEMALGEYRAILAEQPKNGEAYFRAAEVYTKTKNYSRAIANYRLAYKFEPTMSAAYEGIAKVYEALGDKKKAAEERAKDPKNRPAEEVAAPVAEAAPAEPAPAAPAAPVAEAPKAEPPAPQKVAEPAPEPVKVSEPAPAPQKVAEPAPQKPAVSAEPAAPTDPFEKGKAFLAEGKYKEAATMWREVLAKQPGHAGAYFYAGVTRYEMGEYDKAEFNLKKGLAYKEQGNDANYYLALIYQKTNRADQEKKALAAYLKKAAPDGKFRASAESRLAEMKAAVEAAKAAETETATEKKPAETPAQAAAKPAPSVEKPVAPSPAAADDEYSVANANLLYKSGNLGEALRVYKALLDKGVSTDEYYFSMLQMGNIYRELRDFHSAASRYREVVQQYPDSDWATEAERALEDAVWLENHRGELPRRKR
jgi:tetratricopeptide (TPR) repeat protein